MIEEIYQLFGKDSKDYHPKKLNIKKSALIVAPHPDDESIQAGLFLRLKEELNCDVYVYPFSLGSKLDRQGQRHEELKSACEILDFKLLSPVKNPIEYLEKINPDIITLPHLDDGHTTHKRCYVEWMKNISEFGYEGTVLLNEFWFPMRDANLIIEVPKDIVIKQIAALKCHQGEILRNPYDKRLPFWLLDNTRRGFEQIMGNLTTSTDLIFTQLFKKIIISKNKVIEIKSKDIIRAEDNLIKIFNLE